MSLLAGTLLAVLIGICSCQNPGEFADVRCQQAPLTQDCGLSPVVRYYYDSHTLQCTAFQYRGCGEHGNNFLNQMDCLAVCFIRHEQSVNFDPMQDVEQRLDQSPDSLDLPNLPSLPEELQNSPLAMFMSPDIKRPDLPILPEELNAIKNLKSGDYHQKSEDGEKSSWVAVNRNADALRTGRQSGPDEQDSAAELMTQEHDLEPSSDELQQEKEAEQESESKLNEDIGDDAKEATISDEISKDAVAFNEKCDTPPETGPCRALLRRWFYDSEVDECMTFSYGGCAGTANNHLTQEACERECKPSIGLVSAQKEEMPVHNSAAVTKIFPPLPANPFSSIWPSFMQLVQHGVYLSSNLQRNDKEEDNEEMNADARDAGISHATATFTNAGISHSSFIPNNAVQIPNSAIQKDESIAPNLPSADERMSSLTTDQESPLLSHPQINIPAMAPEDVVEEEDPDESHPANTGLPEKMSPESDVPSINLEDQSEEESEESEPSGIVRPFNIWPTIRIYMNRFKKDRTMRNRWRNKMEEDGGIKLRFKERFIIRDPDSLNPSIGNIEPDQVTENQVDADDDEDRTTKILHEKDDHDDDHDDDHHDDDHHDDDKDDDDDESKERKGFHLTQVFVHKNEYEQPRQEMSLIPLIMMKKLKSMLMSQNRFHPIMLRKLVKPYDRFEPIRREGIRLPMPYPKVSYPRHQEYPPDFSNHHNQFRAFDRYPGYPEYTTASHRMPWDVQSPISHRQQDFMQRYPVQERYPVNMRPRFPEAEMPYMETHPEVQFSPRGMPTSAYPAQETTPDETDADICSFPVDVGACHGRVLEIRWFYNQEYDRCQSFYYAGCGRNGNRFRTEVDCLRRCSGYQSPVAIPKGTPVKKEFIEAPKASIVKATTKEVVREISTTRPAIIKTTTGSVFTTSEAKKAEKFVTPTSTPMEDDTNEINNVPSNANKAENHVRMIRLPFNGEKEFGTVLAVLIIGVFALLVLAVFATVFVIRKLRTTKTNEKDPKKNKIIEAVLEAHLNGSMPRLHTPLDYSQTSLPPYHPHGTDPPNSVKENKKNDENENM